MKRVLIILDNGFAPDVRVSKEALYLVSNNYEVTIYAWDRESHHIDKPVEMYRGIKIVRFFIPSIYGSGVKQSGALLKFAFSCRKLFQTEKRYDFVHCSDLNGILAGAILGAKRKLGYKLVFDMKEVYESGNLSRFRILIRLLVRQMQNRSDWIIYLNEQQKKDVKARNVSKLVFLPNYPERDTFQPKEKSFSDKLRVSFIGYLRHEKQLKALIDAAWGYPNDIEVCIFGAGVVSVFESIKKHAKDCVNCHVAGGFNHNTVGALYQKTDILYFVYDSDDENDKNAFPSKLYEAIITNTPMIVAKGTIHGDFCKEKGIGFCVSKDYKKDIEKVFEQVIADRGILEIMAENLRVLEEEYVWESAVKSLDVIYS